VKYGSTTLATLTTSGLVSGATNMAFTAEIYITCLRAGATGAMMVDGYVMYEATAGARVFDALNTTAHSVALNTTAPGLLDVTVAWDTATTSRTVTSFSSSFEVLN
jgi:hypothetical protein